MAVYFIIKGIYEYEDYLEDKKFDGTRDNEKEKTTWEKMCEKLGWETFKIE